MVKVVLHNFIFVLFLLAFSCSENPTEIKEMSTLTDIDGNVYQIVKIGNQWWMAENLKVTHYRNGEAILNVTSNSEWAGLSTGAYCAYNNDNSNIDEYGLLYNWYTIKDSRKIAPLGWHVPTEKEYTTLEKYLIANGYNWDGSTSGNKIGKSLSSITGWDSSYNSGTVGNNISTNNSSGFTALPGGYRSDYGTFNHFDEEATFWSATQSLSNYAIHCSLYSFNVGFYISYRSHKRYGFSLRLIQD